MAVITQEQALELESNVRFQNVSKQYIRDIATYLLSQNGTAGNLAGRTPEAWAKVRFIGAGITFHPNSQNYQEWVSQFTMSLKGQDVWQTDADGTIDTMIASGKFEELANIAYDRRSQVIEF
jgi:hypothetical protein